MDDRNDEATEGAKDDVQPCGGFSIEALMRSDGTTQEAKERIIRLAKGEEKEFISCHKYGNLCTQDAN